MSKVLMKSTLRVRRLMPIYNVKKDFVSMVEKHSVLKDDGYHVDLSSCFEGEIPSIIIDFLLQLNKKQPIVELNISGNYLRSIPIKLFRLISLQVFNVSSNRLAKIQESIGDLQSLLILNINGNCITELPASIADLPLLKVIGLEGNN